jgi:hypothetical protein
MRNICITGCEDTSYESLFTPQKYVVFGIGHGGTGIICSRRDEHNKALEDTYDRAKSKNKEYAEHDKLKLAAAEVCRYTPWMIRSQNYFLCIAT